MKGVVDGQENMNFLELANDYMLMIDNLADAIRDTSVYWSLTTSDKTGGGCGSDLSGAEEEKARTKEKLVRIEWCKRELKQIENELRGESTFNHIR
jgi:hypothetical protein